MGVVLPADMPPETETDLNKLASVENFTKTQIEGLKNIVSAYHR